jgi:fibronectin-binding autotransporter adhesin
MKRLSFAATLGALLAFVAGPASAQNTYTWNTTPSGAWLSTASWYSTAGANYPGTSTAPGGGATTDIARFALQNGTASGTVGIDGTAAGTLSLGAIDFANSSSVTIASSTGAGLLQLNGATVNSVANTLVAVRSNANNQTIAGTNGLGLQLGITNGIFNVFGDANPITTTVPFFGGRTLTISAAISEANAGSGFILQGGGNLVLSGTNTFTGDVTITSGRIQISNASALGTTAGKTVVNTGGTLHITSAMTLNENIDLAGNGFTEHATLFGALRIDNVATTLGGNLTLTGNSRIWVAGNTTTANGTITETGGTRGLDFAGAGTFALNNAGSYTGATTVSQGILNLTGTAGALSGTTGITALQGGTFRVSNTATDNLANRVNNAATITLNNGTFNFAHTAGAANYAESVGALSLPHYQNTVSTSQAAAGQTSALTFASVSRAANTGGVNFVGTGLGTNDQNRIFFTANPALIGGAQAAGGIIGGWATYNMTATDGFFASYTPAGGVVQSTITTNLDPATWTTGSNLKFTGVEPKMTAAAGERVANSLTFVGGGAGSILYFQGNAVRLQSGGVIVTNNPGSFFSAEVAGSTLTAGTAANTAGELIFNIAAGSDLTQANIQFINNGTGAVGITKLGGGNLSFNNANTFSGPLVISSTAGNSSGVIVTNEEGIGTTTFPSAITLKAGGGGGQGTFLQINATLNDVNSVLRPITSPLSIESFVTGGVSNNLGTLQAGVNLRASLMTNSNNNYSGPITITGNHFAQIYQTTAANTFTISGNITAGAGGFTGLLLGRGSGTVALNGTVTLPNATIATTDNTTILLPTTATNVLGLNPQTGSIRLRGSSLLPAAVTVMMGQTGNGNVGQFWLNGFNQTIARLGIEVGSTGVNANQLVVNNANTNSTLTFAGGSGPVSVFNGTIANIVPASAATGTLAVAVTSGTLNLNGANTYTGGTTVSGTGTLGGTGSVTGSLNINSGGNLAPGNSIGTLSVTGAGSVTTWAGAGRYTVEYDHNGGAFTPGTNIDLFASAGTLNVTASAGTPFVIDLRYLGLPNVASTGPQQVTIASFSAPPTLTSAQFTVTGDMFVGSSGSISVVGNNVVLNFTPVPEPATVGLLAAGVLGGVAALRRRRKAA